MLGDVRTRLGGLNQAQLYFLKRFWLADGVAVKEARQRTVSFAPSFRRSLAGEVPEDLGFFLQQIVNAAAPAILYGLLALAYGLVYGLTNRINLAFGDMATLGAFAALSGAAFATRAGLGDGVVMVAMAALVAAVSASVWGALFGAKVALPLIARAPQVLLIATTGAGIAIQEFLARAQGSGDHWLSPVMTERFLLTDGPFPVEITAMQMLIVTGGFGLALMTLAAMRVSAFGRKWRAASDDGLMSEMLGINVRGLVVVTFALSTALAGVAGAIFTLHYGATSFHMGTMIGLKALVGAIVGGIGSPAGAFLGGIAVGLIETLWSAYHGLVWREVVILALLAIFLILRPEGLFGRRD
jgi:branched-chain amino acid transport system permease protein